MQESVGCMFDGAATHTCQRALRKHSQRWHEDEKRPHGRCSVVAIAPAYIRLRKRGDCVTKRAPTFALPRRELQEQQSHRAVLPVQCPDDGNVESPRICGSLHRQLNLARETHVMISSRHGADKGCTTEPFPACALSPLSRFALSDLGKYRSRPWQA
jgi:hypothetical protein